MRPSLNYNRLVAPVPERHLAVAGSRDWLVSRLGAELASKVHTNGVSKQRYPTNGAYSKASPLVVTDNEEIKKMGASILHTATATCP